MIRACEVISAVWFLAFVIVVVTSSVNEVRCVLVFGGSRLFLVLIVFYRWFLMMIGVLIVEWMFVWWFWKLIGLVVWVKSSIWVGWLDSNISVFRFRLLRV